MVKDIDTRTTSPPGAAGQQLFATEAPSTLLPESLPVKVSGVNLRTGTPARVVAEHGSGTGKISEALNYVQKIAPVLGFPSGAVPEFIPDPHIQSVSSGASVVHLHQHHHGVPVFQMVRDVRFSRTGTIMDVVGDSVHVPPDFQIVPHLGVKEAFTFLLEFVVNSESEEERKDQFGEVMPPPDLSQYSAYNPKVLLSFPTPSSPTVLEQGPFERPPTGHLIIFHEHPQFVLGWYFDISLSDCQGDYHVIVGAEKEKLGQILYSRETSYYLTARAHVFTAIGGGNNDREWVEFPRAGSSYPVDSDPLANFPRDWITSHKTEGNSTKAVLGYTNNTYAGVRTGDVVTFNPSNATGDDQKLLNIFYYCCYMHDFFFKLGFDEASGNFQEVNFSGSGSASDSVTARAHSGAVWGTANMRTPSDGWNPTMNMGLVTSTNRHTAFDADVVFHEFVHGITNRCVGGRMNTNALSEPQSRGMGEGWSDFFALTVQNYYRDTEKTTMGSWIVNDRRGIRRYPYTDNFPDNFGDLGTGRYTSRNYHAIGEIWCAALMTLLRKYVRRFGKHMGYNLMWRIVFDSLKIMPANPSFIDACMHMDKAALDHYRNGGITTAEFEHLKKDTLIVWAHYGMGFGAKSVGASLSGIEASFTPSCIFVPCNLM